MKLRIAAGVVAVASLAVGCSHAPNVAAQSQEFTVMESDLQSVMQACSQLGLKVQGRQQEVLSRITFGKTAEAYLKSKGVDVDQRKARNAVAKESGLAVDNACIEVDYPLGLLHSYPEAFANQQEFLEYAKTIDVVVNPRYGTWNPANLSAEGEGSISMLSGAK